MKTVLPFIFNKVSDGVSLGLAHWSLMMVFGDPQFSICVCVCSAATAVGAVVSMKKVVC